MSDNFDPNSHDAVFARILQKLDTVDKTTMRIETQAKITNGRVTALEREKWTQRGVVAGIAAVASMVWHYLITLGQ